MKRALFTRLPVRYVPRAVQHVRWNSSKDIFSLDIDLGLGEPISTRFEGGKSIDVIMPADEPLKSPFEDQAMSNIASQIEDNPQYDFFADLDFESAPKDGPSQLDKIFADLSEGSGIEDSVGHYKRVDIDKTDEDVLLGEEDAANMDAVLTEEKQLFQKIFDTYALKEDLTTPEVSLNQALWSLRDSLKATRRKLVEHISSTDEVLPGQRSSPVDVQLFNQTKEALESTFFYLSDKTQLELVDFLRTQFERYYQKDFSGDFYFFKARLESMDDYKSKCDGVCRDIRVRSESNPSEPILNAFTMPVIFNHILQLLSTKLYDGQLALTLFNSLKKDLNLYTVVCNQQTYNEILKIYWIYRGKSSLYEIELIYLEMANNGFKGDMQTFSILKEIIVSYHTIRMGKSNYSPHRVPIWSQEDDRRVQNLERKLTLLSRSLNKARWHV